MGGQQQQSTSVKLVAGSFDLEPMIAIPFLVLLWSQSCQKHTKKLIFVSNPLVGKRAGCAPGYIRLYIRGVSGYRAFVHMITMSIVARLTC
jgi:hypothetical protein